jgi:ABC-type enterochelin transport system ATPase subunit
MIWGTANVLPQLQKAGLNIKAYDIGRTIDSSKLVLKQLANFFGVLKIADSLNQKLDADLLNAKNALVSIHIVDAPSVMVIQLKHLQQFLNERTIIIAVLHDLNLALNYADEILLLNKGKLFSSGKPGDVLSPENINAVFQLEFKLHHFNDVQFLWPVV